MKNQFEEKNLNGLKESNLSLAELMQIRGGDSETPKLIIPD